MKLLKNFVAGILCMGLAFLPVSAYATEISQGGQPDTDTNLSQEQVEDYAGGMWTGNTETFITVTYQDVDGTIDAVVPVLDEDGMGSDSDTDLATQQSIKAYVDGLTGANESDPVFSAETTFAALNTRIADKTLVNEEDAATWDSLQTFTGDVLLSGGRDYLFTADGADGLGLQIQDSGVSPTLGFFTKDGDGTDWNSFNFYAVGTPGSTVNRERLQMQWEAGNSLFSLHTEADGTGTLRPLVFYTEGNSNQLVLATNGAVGVGLTPVAGTRLTLPLENDAVTPTLAFGDGDTGFYERADDAIAVTANGVLRWVISSNTIKSDIASGAWIKYSGATTTAPTLGAYQTDSDTGIGGDGADTLSLITGGVEGLRIDDNQDATFTGTVRATTSSYRRYYHLPIASFDPGVSGASWADASANNVAGWQLNSDTDTLEFNTDVHSDWDGVTDLEVEVFFQVSDATTVNTDTVDLVVAPYYMGVGDTATKTQAIAENVTVTDGTQWKMYSATFVIDEDAGGANVDPGDKFSFSLHMETDTSEVDDVIVTNVSYNYQTTHIGVESGDV